MQVFVESLLDCSPGAVWKAVQTLELLQHVSAPLIRFKPISPNPLPDVWRVGDKVELKVYAFGFLPLGGHSIHIARISPETHEIQSDESGALVRVWRHTIKVRAGKHGKTLYSDEVQIEAGFLTFPVWLWANWFYRHRHNRWRKLAPTLDGGST